MGLPVYAAIGGVVLLDVVLSGDNAIVIAAAASRLPRPKRLVAIAWGGLGAIIFRVALTAGATKILQVPLLQAIGGLLLLGIAVQIALPTRQDGKRRFGASERLLVAMGTILLADATMSLDNILAIAALAAGNVLVIAIGLSVSMAALFVASALIARLMDRLPWLLDLAALLIAWTAATRITSDPFVLRRVPLTAVATAIVEVVCVGLVLTVIVAVHLRQRGHRGQPPAPTAAPSAAGMPQPPQEQHRAGERGTIA